MSNESAGSPVTVRADRYEIAVAFDLCPRCGIDTVLVALVVPRGHETVDDDDSSPLGGAELWSTRPYRAIVFDLTCLPREVADRMRTIAPRFGREAPHVPDGKSSWTNHCEHCGYEFADDDVFCEPDGAFLPTSVAKAQGVQLVPVASALGVACGGYAVEPEFLRFIQGR